MLHQQIQLYPDRDDVSLTTYVLDDSREMLNGGLRPAVLVCPGGGYMMCSDREAEPIALAYTAMGYHAFVLRYSTFFGKNFNPKRMENPDCAAPQPMLDIAEALLYIQAHAQAWFVDMEQIAISGFSAGGHNCAMYAMLWNKQAYWAEGKPWVKPAMCILGYPMVDLEQVPAKQMLVSPGNQDEPDLRELFMRAYFGSETPTKQQLIQNSPHQLVSKDTPPMFIWTTSADTLVPTNNSLQLALSLSGHRIPFELHVFEQGEHGLSTATHASSHQGRFIDEDAAKWIPLCAAWLKKHFTLPLNG